MSIGLTGEDRAALLRALSEAPDFLTAAGRRRFVRDIFRPYAYFSQLDANQLQDVNWDGKPRVVGDELLRVLDGHEAGPGVGAIAVLEAAMLAKAREAERAADARADMFSLGMILYELLTGAYPFGGDLEERKGSLANPPTSPETLAPEIPTGLAKGCMDCLRVHLAARIPRAKASLGRFRPFAGENATGARGGRDV